MMDQSMLERVLAGLPLAEIRYYQSLNSTNDAAAAWAADGAPDCALVVANQQIQGRGRAGRSWLTVPGAALAFSLILRPTIWECEHAGTLLSRFTGLGAVSVTQTLRNHYDLPAYIKWPNDVLVKDKKICGILVEAEWLGAQPRAVILGIGINIATRAVPSANSLKWAATSLQEGYGSLPDRSLVLRQVLVEIIRWRLLLLEQVFLHTWQEHLAYFGEWVQLTTTDHRDRVGAVLVQGRLVGLGPGGELRLRMDNGESQSFRMGEIQLRPVDSLPKSAKLTASNKNKDQEVSDV
jgi:BirA family biotin operon repressor/biotin-[acetyl-CoA-carboxylase] ligase